MWILFAILSAVCLGFYDIFKKLSVTGNNVLTVLFYYTLFSALFMLPVVIGTIAEGSIGFGGDPWGHFHIFLKSLLVLVAYILEYYAVKHLPLTISGSINATRPVMVLLGALLIFGERLNMLQWIGMILGFVSLFLVSRVGSKDGFSPKNNTWFWLMVGATVLTAISGLYDKFISKRYEPMQVMAWYTLYQLVLMGILIVYLKRRSADKTPFRWRWTIPCIAIFITIGDLIYFHSLSLDGAMISVVSTIRRGSVLVTFIYGIVALHEKNVKLKIIDLSILLAGLIFLVLGSE